MAERCTIITRNFMKSWNGFLCGLMAKNQRIIVIYYISIIYKKYSKIKATAIKIQYVSH